MDDFSSTPLTPSRLLSNESESEAKSEAKSESGKMKVRTLSSLFDRPISNDTSQLNEQTSTIGQTEIHSEKKVDQNDHKKSEKIDSNNIVIMRRSLIKHNKNGRGHFHKSERAVNEGNAKLMDEEAAKKMQKTHKSDAARQLKKLGSAADRFIRNIEQKEDEIEDAMMETLDYDDVEALTQEDKLIDGRFGKCHALTLFVFKVICTIAIAFIIAMAMWLVSSLISYCVSFRVNNVLALFASGNPVGAYFVKISISIMYCLISASLVAILAPDARGSGVPFCMAYLNGTNVSSYFSPRIVIVKIVSLGFTIASGLTLGKEGPFVHIGAGIAYVFAVNLSKFPLFQLISVVNKYTAIVQNIREERIFIAGGMAAGLAVAFTAPIAGILFALEGSTAFMTIPILIRIFGCSMFADFFDEWSNTGFGPYIKNHNLVPLTQANIQQSYAWQFQEIFSFLFLAVICGSFAALITKLNVKLTRWRHHHMPNKTWHDIGKNIGEVCLIVFITATLWFIIPYWFSCTPLNATCEAANGEVNRCLQLQCPAGYYSEIGSIVYATPDGIARLMLDRSIPFEYDYKTLPLLVYVAFYFTLVGISYGIYTPGGLFVPAIVAGAVLGRVLGIWLIVIFPSWGVNTGVYGMLGASAMLGGLNRLVLPIIVMVIEMTGDSTYLLPIMLCGSVAKFFADWLEPPLYPQHMALDGIPQLGDKLKPSVVMLTALDIMLPVEKMITLTSVEKIGAIKRVLEISKRATFVVITEDGRFVGTITRRALVYAVKYGSPFATAQEADQATGEEQIIDPNHNMTSFRDTRDYAATMNANAVIDNSWISIAHYTDTGVLTAHGETPVKRILAVFRKMGTSHLCITDHDDKFLGYVTRRRLLNPPELKTSQPMHILDVKEDVENNASSSSSTYYPEDALKMKDDELS